jgi:hypothetical protein
VTGIPADQNPYSPELFGEILSVRLTIAATLRIGRLSLLPSLRMEQVKGLHKICHLRIL